MWEAIKIVGGGVIGIAGALLIMWWGLDRDPLEFGPKVYKVLPWIVPQKFSGVAPIDDSTAVTQDNADEEPSNKIDTAPKNLGTELDSSVVPWGNKGNEDNETKTVGDGSSTNNNSTNNSSSTSNNNASSKTTKLEPVGIRNAGFVGASDLIGALDDYKKAAGSWISAHKGIDADEMREADSVFFTSLTRFGEIAAYADGTDPEIQMQTEIMVKYLDSLKSRDAEYGSLKFIADSASDWLAEPANRTNAGIMLAGTVLSVKPHGRIFESRVQLANASKETVTVYHLKKPAGDYVSKAQVLVLGVVVDEPSENLIGFEGTDPEVICCARAIVFPMDDSQEGSKPANPDLPVPSIDVPSIKVPSIELPSSTIPSTDTPSKNSNPDPPAASPDTTPEALPAASPDTSPDGAGSAAVDE